MIHTEKARPYFFVFIICLAACTKSKENHVPPLYINYQVAKAVNGEMVSKDSLVNYVTDDIELTFIKEDDGGYSALNYFQKDPAVPEFVGMTVSDSSGVKFAFQSSQDFLKFMTDHGFEKKKEEKHESVMLYSFTRK